jgi:hypothetical protein
MIPRHTTQAVIKTSLLFDRLLRGRLAAYRRTVDGSIAAEAVVIFPILLWALLAAYVYFDAVRMKSLNIKAGYTVADALSRMASVDNTEMKRLSDLAWLMTGGRTETDLRITVVNYDSDDDVYSVSWSKELGDHYPEMDDEELEAMRDRLPLANSFDSLILVENVMSYEPIFEVGMSTMELENFAVTRPRFTTGLCWNETTDC